LNRKFRLGTYLWPILVCAALLFWGCQTKEAPLKPGAATFKKEVKHCLEALATPLREPLTKRNKPEIAAALEKVEPQAVKLCRMCPFQVAALTPDGETLAVHPPTGKASNFSSYDLVIKATNTKKIQQQRFFLQNGSELYIICAPVLNADRVSGLVAIAIGSDEAEKRWGLTEKEFLALNFNT
jgi:hypothetical protein